MNARIHLLWPLSLLALAAGCSDRSITSADSQRPEPSAAAVSIETIAVFPGSDTEWVVQGIGAAQAVFASVLAEGAEQAATSRINARGIRLRVGTSHTDAALVRTERFARTPLSDLTQLSFSTYVLQRGREDATPFMTLAIDLDGDGFIDDHLVFRPTPSLGKWQTWNALEGEWWSNSKIGSPDARGMRTLSSYLSGAPHARLASAITVGAWEVGESQPLVANVDGIVVGIRGKTMRFLFGSDTGVQ